MSAEEVKDAFRNVNVGDEIRVVETGELGTVTNVDRKEHSVRVAYRLDSLDPTGVMTDAVCFGLQGYAEPKAIPVRVS